MFISWDRSIKFALKNAGMVEKMIFYKFIIFWRIPKSSKMNSDFPPTAMEITIRIKLQMLISLRKMKEIIMCLIY